MKEEDEEEVMLRFNLFRQLRKLRRVRVGCFLHFLRHYRLFFRGSDGCVDSVGFNLDTITPLSF